MSARLALLLAWLVLWGSDGGKCHASCPDCGQGKACEAAESAIGHTHRCKRCGYTWS